MKNSSGFGVMDSRQMYPSEPPPNYNDAMQSNPPGHPQMIMMNQIPSAPTYHEQPLPPTILCNVPLPAVALAVGPMPSTVNCPHCQKRGKTYTVSEPQKSAHILAIALCLLGCYLCCCIPYCIPTFQDVHHYCSKCKGFIGTYKP